MKSAPVIQHWQVLMSSLSQRFCGWSEEKNKEREREFCTRGENIGVGSISIRIKRVEKGNKRDRRMKKSMISTSSLLTGDFLYSSFILSYSSLLKVLYSFSKRPARTYNSAALTVLRCWNEHEDIEATHLNFVYILDSLLSIVICWSHL
jgi:hypothetical protein